MKNNLNATAAAEPKFLPTTHSYPADVWRDAVEITRGMDPYHDPNLDALLYEFARDVVIAGEYGGIDPTRTRPSPYAPNDIRAADARQMSEFHQAVALTIDELTRDHKSRQMAYWQASAIRESKRVMKARQDAEAAEILRKTYACPICDGDRDTAHGNVANRSLIDFNLQTAEHTAWTLTSCSACWEVAARAVYERISSEILPNGKTRADTIADILQRTAPPSR